MSVPEVVIRLARPDDAAGVARLAHLDSASVPRGAVLVAEVEGELWAALSLEDFEAVADPFRPTGELVFLLVERGRQLCRDRDRDRSAGVGWRRGLRRPRLRRPALT